MYAMLESRLDLAFTISILSYFCSNLSLEHAIETQQLLRYLRMTTVTASVNPSSYAKALRASG